MTVNFGSVCEVLSSERIVSIEPYKIYRYFNREALRLSSLIMAGRCCIFLLDNLNIAFKITIDLDTKVLLSQCL